ncbi:hypothetical protein IAU60_000605 [Kwoniella sp. DSM 27419]
MSTRGTDDETRSVHANEEVRKRRHRTDDTAPSSNGDTKTGTSEPENTARSSQRSATANERGWPRPRTDSTAAPLAGDDTTRTSKPSRTRGSEGTSDTTFFASDQLDGHLSQLESAYDALSQFDWTQTSDLNLVTRAVKMLSFSTRAEDVASRKKAKKRRDELRIILKEALAMSDRIESGRSDGTATEAEGTPTRPTSTKTTRKVATTSTADSATPSPENEETSQGTEVTTTMTKERQSATDPDPGPSTKSEEAEAGVTTVKAAKVERSKQEVVERPHGVAAKEQATEARPRVIDTPVEGRGPMDAVTPTMGQGEKGRVTDQQRS